MSINGFSARPSTFYDVSKLFRSSETKKIVRKNVSYIIKKEFEYVITKQLNIVIDIFGLPGSGKSENAFALWFLWKKMNKELLDREVHLHISFNRYETINAVKKAKPGDLIIQDEDSRLSGHGSQTAVDQMNNVIDHIRETQISFIFVSPHPKSTLALANLKLEQLLKNYDKRQNFALLRNNADKLLGHVIINLHNDEEFRKQYRALKTQNLEKLKQKQGRDSVQISIEQLEEDSNCIINASIEHNISIEQKRDVELLAALSGVSGHTKYIDYLTNYILKKKVSQNNFFVDDEKSIPNISDSSKFILLRDLICSYFTTKLNVPEPFSRVATAMLLWEKELFTLKGQKLYPSTVKLDLVKRTDIAKMWADKVSAQSIYQAISQYSDQYNECWNKLTTHDLEQIGEFYAYKCLKGALSNFSQIANLNPSLFACSPLFLSLSLSLSRQVRDSFNQDSSLKPYDLALFSDSSVSSFSDSDSADALALDNVALSLFNHKLLTTKRSSSEKRFGEKLDAHPGLKFMWKTETRPFHETISLFIPGEDQDIKLQEAFYRKKYTEIVKKLNSYLKETNSKFNLVKTKAKAKEKEKMKEIIPRGIEIFLEGLGSELDFNNLTLEQVIIFTVIQEEKVRAGKEEV